MAYKRRQRSKRRAFRRRRRGGRARAYRRRFTRGTAVVKRNKQPVPAQLYTQFQYQFTYLNMASTGVPTVQAININSLYDPDATGTGQQPMFYDQLGAIYANYRVYGCKAKLAFKVRDASALESAKMVFYVLRPGQAAPSSYEQACELPRSTSAIASKDKWKYKSMYYDQAAIAGLSRKAYRYADETSAGFGANPTNTNQLCIFVLSYDDTTQVLVDVSIKLTYYVTLFGLKTVSRS